LADLRTNSADELTMEWEGWGEGQRARSTDALVPDEEGKREGDCVRGHTPSIVSCD
jgi:hypothetical protein